MTMPGLSMCRKPDACPEARLGEYGKLGMPFAQGRPVTDCVNEGFMPMAAPCERAEAEFGHIVTAADGEEVAEEAAVRAEPDDAAVADLHDAHEVVGDSAERSAAVCRRLKRTEEVQGLTPPFVIAVEAPATCCRGTRNMRASSRHDA